MFPSKEKEYQRAYIKKYMKKRRTIANRQPIEIEKNGYKFILLKAKHARIHTKKYPNPCFMGHENYVLHEVKKINTKN